MREQPTNAGNIGVHLGCCPSGKLITTGRHRVPRATRQCLPHRLRFSLTINFDTCHYLPTTS
ncbi:hypothetical protein PanWU01x14_171760 [Parasponia andersonii]|uniref:Uncharacterized protein n=1 Tax=Parasponia andersonii TaxID=3476 RepID=A0A2P5C9A3_PARAD|nr:hypothetical protein PanWU01x14_171760 [Parasponia andersonii]